MKRLSILTYGVGLGILTASAAVAQDVTPARPAAAVEPASPQPPSNPKWYEKILPGRQKQPEPLPEQIVRDADGRYTVVAEPDVIDASSAPAAKKPRGGVFGSWLPSLSRPAPNEAAGRRNFESAEQLFREEKYAQAAREFRSIAKKYKDTAVEEDALYYRAEAEFKQQRYPVAQDTYAKLLTKYPTTRFLPQAVQRMYDIADYWLEDSRQRALGQPGKFGPVSRTVNLFDKTRPILDTNGRAIEAIETIQQHDPFGPLTDDAVMMAGAQKFLNGNYVQAASYYEQLVGDQPKSEHAGKAMVLGAQAYLRAYEGPQYDGGDLDNAEKMTKLALTRAVDATPEQKDWLQNDLRNIKLQQAKRDYSIAEFYAWHGKYASARYYYELVMKKHPDTDWARRAEEESKRLEGVPNEKPTLVKRLGQVVGLRGTAPTPTHSRVTESAQPAPVVDAPAANRSRLPADGSPAPRQLPDVDDVQTLPPPGGGQ